MIKCEVTREFDLKDFDKLVDIKRKTIDTKGKLYVGDTFRCDKEMCDYLSGNNRLNETVVKVLEVEPEKEQYPDITEITFELRQPTIEHIENVKKTPKKRKSNKK